MWSFSGDESVHPFGSCLFQFASRAAGDHADALADLGAAGNYQRLCAGRCCEPPGEFCATNFLAHSESCRLSMTDEERARLFQAHGGTEHRIISQSWMRIQWQMGTVNRQIIFN